MDWQSAEIRLFGHAPTPARSVIVDRSPAWRAGRFALLLVASVGVGLLAALVPPHLPWAAFAVVVGIAFASRKLLEHRSLIALEGRCPRCDSPVGSYVPRRLREPDRFPCDGCAHVLTLVPPR